MLEYLPYLYDLAAVVLLLSYIMVSARRGFASTMITFIGYVVALASAKFLSTLMAPAIFDMTLRDGLVTKVQSALTDSPQGIELAGMVAGALEALPSYVAGLLDIGGYNADGLLAMLVDYPQKAATTLVDEVVAPVVIGLISTVLFFVLFSAIMLVVHSLARFFYGVRSIPVVGPINSLLGGAVGLLTGAICLCVVLVLLEFVLMFTGDALEFFNQDVLDQTYTYRLWQRFEPAGLTGIFSKLTNF